MRVVMTKSTRGSENGIRVGLYEEGKEYELGEALARSFIGSKRARPVLAPDDATKQAKGPAENK